MLCLQLTYFDNETYLEEFCRDNVSVEVSSFFHNLNQTVIIYENLIN